MLIHIKYKNIACNAHQKMEKISLIECKLCRKENCYNSEYACVYLENYDLS